MELPRPQPRLYTVQEYLRLELEAEEKHEYRDGQIVSMSGGSYFHSLIIANVIAELANRLKGKPCRALESNLRVRIPRKAQYTYPDATVVCGAPQFEPDDVNRHTILNPRVVVEVLSPSSEAYDRGVKFSLYREIESLEEYVLISQDVPSVETFRRRDGGNWMFASFSGMDATARLESIEIALPLAEVFAGVEFPPAQDGGTPPQP